MNIEREGSWIGFNKDGTAGMYFTGTFKNGVTILLTYLGHFHLTFSVASKSVKLKYSFEQNQNQTPVSLRQHYPIDQVCKPSVLIMLGICLLKLKNPFFA
jgi:hypothetical protein